MLDIIQGVLRVAVVDDVQVQADYLEAMIKSATKGSVEVETFTNPKDALDALRKGRFYAVFTDIHMAEMMGDDLVREVNKMNLGIQTFVLTGDDGFINALNCFRLGCREIFIKPAKNKKISEAMQRLESDFSSWRQTFQELQERRNKKKEKAAS